VENEHRKSTPLLENRTTHYSAEPKRKKTPKRSAIEGISGLKKHEVGPSRSPEKSKGLTEKLKGDARVPLQVLKKAWKKVGQWKARSTRACRRRNPRKAQKKEYLREKRKH